VARRTVPPVVGTTAAPALPLDERARLHRRTLRVLVASQVLGGLGLAAGVTVGALLAEDVLGATALAGLPAALLTLGSAGAALAVGALSERRGRRPGLAAGYLTGALGAAGVVLAAALPSPALLVLSLLLYGAGTATSLQARYAGADLALPERRGTALSTVLVATTVGAVAGPNLVAATGAVAGGLGLPTLAGPFALGALAYGAAGLVLLTALRPDPLLAARRLHAQATAAAAAAGDAPLAPGRVDVAAVRLGAVVMVVTQLVMVAVMTMTPVHMRDHGHGLTATGLVIGLHVAAMFLPSPLTGRLADRYGPRPVAVGGGVSLLAAGLLAATAPVDSVAALALALALLGLGWNLGLLAGTTLLTAALPLGGRARTQGRVDVAVALAGAAGGLGAASSSRPAATRPCRRPAARCRWWCWPRCCGDRRAERARRRPSGGDRLASARPEDQPHGGVPGAVGDDASTQHEAARHRPDPVAGARAAARWRPAPPRPPPSAGSAPAGVMTRTCSSIACASAA
jgi:MFS family permease